MLDRLTPNPRASDTERRVENMIRFGVIEEADYANARVRVRAGDILTDWIPFTAGRAGGVNLWSPPAVGEQVVFASPGGDMRQGVVLGSVNGGSNPAAGNTGDTTKLAFPGGSVAITPSGVTVVVGGVTFSISGGGVAISGGTVTHNGKNIGATHTHSGVSPGPSNTGRPV